MEANQLDRLEGHLRALGGDFRYPPAPDLAGSLRESHFQAVRRHHVHRRIAWGLMSTLLALMLFVAAVPQARAAVGKVLRLGAVRILIGDNNSPEVGTTDPGNVVHSTQADFGLDLAGETTLERAAAQVPFLIKLPTYPADLGSPDRIFLQDSGGAVLILVWLRPEAAEAARMVLYIVETGAFVSKQEPPIIRRATVDGRPAIWTEGPHFLRTRRGEYDRQRLVQGHVLIWMADDGVTYRLETTLPLTEAVKVAESLR
jgi:hypothetical protein